MKRLFFLLILWLPCLLWSQQNITIKGNAPYFANQPVTLTKYKDYITQTEKVIAGGTISGTGSFHLVAENETSGEFFLHVGSISHSLILEPGHVYETEIPDASGEDLYFPTETDTMLLLYQISNLDYDVNYFSVYHYEDFNTGKIKTTLPKFIDSLKTKYSFMNQDFFVQYLQYKIAELSVNARSASIKTLFETYLKDQPVLYGHPQYMIFFNSLYTGAFNLWIKQDNSGKYMAILERGASIDSLLSLIQKQPICNDARIAEMVAAKGLMDIYYAPGIKKDNIEKLIIQLQQKTTSTDIKLICENILDIVQKLKPGKPYLDFSGKNTEGEVVQLSTWLNKPVYLMFFSPDDAESNREMAGLKNVYDEYKKDMNFVGVCANCTYTSLQQFINENKLKWTFFIIDPSVEYDYEVVTYPTAYMIDKDGLFIESPAPLPSAGAGLKIYNYIKEMKRKSR